MSTVLIIDDHDIIRYGLEALAKQSPELQLMGSVGTLADGLKVIADSRPDLVVTDMSMDDSEGLSTVRAVIAAQAPRYTLVVSMYDENLYGEQVLALGAHGYLMKDRARDSFVPAALAVLRGQTWVSPQLSTRLLNRLLHRNKLTEVPGDGTNALTLREVQVLESLKSGKTSKEIAYELHLSPRTVDIHRANIKRKLGFKTGMEVIAYALSRT